MILTDLIEVIKARFIECHESVVTLLMNTHDVLAYCVERPLVFRDYTRGFLDGTEYTSGAKPTWSFEHCGLALTAKTLVYQQYWMLGGLDWSIDQVSPKWDGLHWVLKSLTFQAQRFGPIAIPHPIDLNQTDLFYINQFRSYQAPFRAWVRTVLDSEDVTDFITDRIHGQLSSIGLLYALLYLRVILSFENRVRASPASTTIADAIEHALKRLSGVYLDG